MNKWRDIGINNLNSTFGMTVVSKNNFFCVSTARKTVKSCVDFVIHLYDSNSTHPANYYLMKWYSSLHALLMSS